MKETELYKPVKKLLEEKGYVIKGEVDDADIAAVREDELLIVELKTSFSIKLLTQAAKRQRMTDFVYIAIPRPVYKKRFNKDFKDREFLLRRLGLGLILVAMDAKEPYAVIAIEPGGFDFKRSRAASAKKTASLLREHAGRSSDFNTGGSVRKKLVTAYRENALMIAYVLNKNGCMKTRDLKNSGCPANTTAILYDNHYEWFEKTARAQYRLSKKGKKALVEYREILKHIVKEENDE